MTRWNNAVFWGYFLQFPSIFKGETPSIFPHSQQHMTQWRSSMWKVKLLQYGLMFLLDNGVLTSPPSPPCSIPPYSPWRTQKKGGNESQNQDESCEKSPLARMRCWQSRNMLSRIHCWMSGRQVSFYCRWSVFITLFWCSKTINNSNGTLFVRTKVSGLLVKSNTDIRTKQNSYFNEGGSLCALYLTVATVPP